MILRSILLIVLALLPVFSISCQAKQTTHMDFNLLFQYGVYEGNILDTFSNTYTKDMVMDPPITLGLKLTDEEKRKIYDKIIEIDFFNYPDEFDYPVSIPPSSYSIYVDYYSKTKCCHWGYSSPDSDPRVGKLNELARLIRDIIESKKEYKRLPQPRGGYA